MQKLGPVEKIYEAYTAIADGHVHLDEGQPSATVTSSDGVKTYTVTWGQDTITANDNASHWQGYPGYPVLAVLLLRGLLPLNRQVAACFAGVNWNALNKQYKRDYAAAAAAVMAQRGLNAPELAAEAARVYAALEALPLRLVRGATPPPRA